MTEIRELYLNSLEHFLLRDSGQRRPDSLSDSMLSALLPEEIIALHASSLQTLIHKVSPEKALQYYEKSFVFLIERIACSRGPIQMEVDSDLLFGELRDRLLKSEHLFQSMKNKYENVLQHMDSGIVLFDPKGALSFVNLKLGHIIGISRERLLGKNLFSLIRSHELPKELRKTMLRLYREMYVYRLLFQEVIDEQGRHFLVSMKYGEELDDHILMSIKDVTEFKKIEQSVYHNDKLAMLGKISASIAHEIRNPLTSIRGFIQLLKPELKKLGKQDYAQIILDEIDRANDIIYEFLNSSKPSAPIKKEIQLACLIKEAALLFQSEALLKNCQIEIEGIDPSLNIRVDTKQIKQVFLNIIKNALEVISEKKDPSNGFIKISAIQKENFVWISIEDNGMGMDSNTFSKLFDPFFTTKEEGTGLGLSVCYRIIKNHGGIIHVDSQVGVGTTFQIQLPI